MNSYVANKKRRLTKLVCVSIVILILITSTFTGCKKQEAGEGAKTTLNKIEFPLNKDVTLTYWCPISSNAVSVVPNYNETKWYKELEKQTGVKINFMHPVGGQSKEQLNILIASRDLPDMIEGGLSGYSGGITKAFSDGIVMDIKGLQDKYGENLTSLYKEYPSLLTMVMTEEGNILSVPFIRGHEKLRTNMGPAVRRDWLKDLNMDIPETIDDWYNMLVAFRDKKGASVPFLASLADLQKEWGLMAAFGINYDFFVDNGKVVYGPIDPRFKDYLSTIKKWYDEGLLYSEFGMGQNTKVFDAIVTTNKTGSLITAVGGGIGMYMNIMKGKDPKFDLVGVPYPSLKAGEKPKFMHRDDIVMPNSSVSITTACKDPEVAMAWLDYGFSKNGNMIMNFGVEGESYNMVDGYPKFTDVIMNNPDGHPAATIGHKYCRAFGGGTFVQDERYLEQYLSLPQQQDSITAWMKNSDEVDKSNTKLRGTLTIEENDKVLKRQVDIKSYVDERFLKFIMGKEPLDKFDQYVSTIQQMGIEDILTAKQQAYDRFLKKFPDAKENKSYNVIDYYRK